MLHQTNVLLSIFILIFSFVFLIFYFKENGFFLIFEQPNCSQECISTFFEGPPKGEDEDLLSLLKSMLVAPPSFPDRTPFDIHEPVWKKLVDWEMTQTHLQTVVDNRPPGIFVEIGASDGHFMSQTLYMERNLSWTGLLVEPDMRSFEILRNRKRNAWLAPVCIYKYKPCSHKFWQRDLEPDLPEHFTQLMMARSKLDTDILAGDEERGRSTLVPCVPLTSLLLASNMTRVDLLTTATGANGDDDIISDAIHDARIDIKMLLIHYPTNRLYSEPYPAVPGYIMDMDRSTLLTKFYLKNTHCSLYKKGDCKRLKYYDIESSCKQYVCMDYLPVWAA